MQRILNDSVSKTVPSQISEISLLFCRDEEIQELNKTYRRKNKPTDVLSFSHIEGPRLEPWEQSLGELVISVDTLRAQAKEFHVSVQTELVRLIVHGVHHLLGYDHEKVSAATAARMRRSEARFRRMLHEDGYC